MLRTRGHHTAGFLGSKAPFCEWEIMPLKGYERYESLRTKYVRRDKVQYIVVPNSTEKHMQHSKLLVKRIFVMYMKTH